MKKLCLALLVFVLILGACNSVTTPAPETSSSMPKVTTDASPTTKAEWPTMDLGASRPESDGYALLDSWGTIPKYRPTYYDYPQWLFELVEEEKAVEADNLYQKTHWDSVGRYIEPDEMGTVTFIKHCNISKEDFLAGLEKWKQQLLRLVASGESFWDIDLSRMELPNADIIYTFDNEIINAYYRRENPVVPEPGTYKTYESYEEYKKAN